MGGKRGPVRYLLRYLVSGSFRAAEEAECEQFGIEHHAHQWMISRAAILSGESAA